MNGAGKTVAVVLIAVVLLVSAFVALVAIKRAMERENPADVISASLNVGDPMRSLDSDGDMEADFAENMDVKSSESEVNAEVDTDGDGVPDSQEIAASGFIYVDMETGSAGLKGDYDSLNAPPQVVDNESLTDTRDLTTGPMTERLFPGYGDEIRYIIQNRGGAISVARHVHMAAMNLPRPDMAWIRENSRVMAMMDPSMNFSEDGFIGTTFNMTTVHRVQRVDENGDGNPEYLRIASYANLTRDENRNGIDEVIVVRYSMEETYDNDSDGTPEFRKWVRVYAMLVDENENGYFERRVVQVERGYFIDENDDGVKEVVKVGAIGNQTVDENENRLYEFHLEMLGRMVRYDNNSDGNPEFMLGFFGVRARVNENDDANLEYLGVSVTGYQLKDSNSDGNPEKEGFIHWRYSKVDQNDNGMYEEVRGMAAGAVYYDNNSDGNHEYAVVGLRGVSYVDHNENGRPENGIRGVAFYEVRDDNDDGYNESEKFYMAIVNATDNNEDDHPEFIWKVRAGYERYDNDSDGTPEFRRFMAGGWIRADRNENDVVEHAGVFFTAWIYVDENDDGNPENITSRTFYRERWDMDEDGIYEFERGVAKNAFRYDNNSNGVFEEQSYRLYGFALYRNITHDNGTAINCNCSDPTAGITEIRLRVVLANATNVDDAGFNEFENLTTFVVHRVDGDADGNPEYVHVWGVKHRQFVNETGLYNRTARGVYQFWDDDDDGLRDYYELRAHVMEMADYDLDGIWDYEDSWDVVKTGTDE